MGVGLIPRVGFIVGRALAAHQVGAVPEHIIRARHGRSAPATAHVNGPQIAAVREHPAHFGHLGRIETAQVKTRQAAAVTEHGIHIGHLGRVEVAHIKACQACAQHEHIGHVGHLAGVQVLHARDGLKVLHVKEPIVGGRRAGIGKRRVKDNPGHIGIGAVGVPTGIVGARVQDVGRARAAAALAVVVERQRRVRRRENSIGFFIGKVARIACAAVEVGVGGIDMIGIIGRALAAHQTGAVKEHISRVRHGSSAPTTAHTDVVQIIAVCEHLCHVGHPGRVETAQVKACQFPAGT